MSTRPPADVFIAYAREDLPRARELREALQRAGINNFLDTEDAEPGRWSAQLREAQSRARYTVVVLTERSAASSYAASEVQHAIRLAATSGHVPVPWRVDGLPEDRWPPGLDQFQAYNDVEHLVRRLAGQLQRKVGGAAREDLLRDAIRHLETAYPSPKARRLLAKEAGISLSGGWEELHGHDAADIVALLRADESREASTLAEQIERSVSIRPAPSDLNERQRTAFEQAADLLSKGDFLGALAAFDAIAALSDANPTLEARCRLNAAAALNGLGQLREASLEIDPALLPPPSRISLAKFHLGRGEYERALAAAPDAPLIRQLVAVRRDERVPEGALEPDPDLLLGVGMIEFQSGLVQDAVEHACQAIAIEGVLPLGFELAARVWCGALARQWFGEALQLLRDPASVLSDLHTALLTHEDWHDVKQMLEALEGGPPTGLNNGPVPAWVSRLREARDRADLEALAEENPRNGEILTRLAELRAEADPEAAAQAARAAFELLPGRGQRLLLVRMSANAGRMDEARALLGPVESHPAAWPVRVRLTENLGERLELAQAWAEAQPDTAEPWFRVLETSLHLADVATARAAGHRLLRWLPTLNLNTCRAVAAAALLGGDPDRTLAAALERHLAAEWPHDPKAQTLRLQLHFATGAAPSAPIPMDELVKEGIAWRFDVHEAVDFLSEGRARATQMDRFWSAGALSFETWAKVRPFQAGLFAVALLRGEFGVAPPCPPTRPAEWRGRSVLLGSLAIELLVALDLHELLADTVQTITVFEDTWSRYMNAPLHAGRASWAREDVRTRRLWAPVEDLPDGGDPTLDAADAAGVRAWLVSLGRLAADGSSAVPKRPPSTCVLGAPALLAMEAFLEPFVLACEQHGIVLQVARQAREQRRRRETENRLRSDGDELAARMAGWLGGLARGKLQVAPLPDTLQLPPPPGGGEEPAFVVRAFATREFLHNHPDVVVITAELSELGIYGLGPPVLIEHREWDEGTRGVMGRHRAAAQRGVTVATVARALATEARRPEVVHLLALAGYPDAMEGRDALALLRQTLDRPEAGTPPGLLGLVRWGRLERQAHHSMLAMHVGFAVGGGVLDALVAAPAEDQARVAMALFDALEAMDGHTQSRLGLVSHALHAAALMFFNPRAFVVKTGATKVELGRESVGGVLWQPLSAWAANRPQRVGKLAVAFALAASGRAAEEAPPALRRAAHQIMVTFLPGHALDFTAPVWAVLLTEDTGVLRGVDSHGRSVQGWVDAALSAQPELDEIDLEAQVDGHTVRIPAIILLPRAPEVAPELSDAIWAHDARLAAVVAQYTPEPGGYAKVVLAERASPVRSVRQDPCTILTWSRYEGRTGGPKTVDELLHILGGAEGIGGTNWPDWLASHLEPAWGTHSVVDKLRQLSRVPGDTVGARATRVPPEQVGAQLTAWVRLKDIIADVAAGDIATTIVALALTATQHDGVSIGERLVRPAELAAEIAVAALAPPPEGNERRYALLEPAIVRTCSTVIDALVPDLPPRLRTIYSWRLYGWLTDQLPHAPDPGASARHLADAAPPTRAPDEVGGDLYDPARLGEGGLDVREIIVLQALNLAMSDESEMQIAWQSLVPTLLRIAARPLTPHEALVRPIWRESSLGGRPLVAPDLARRLLLFIDHSIVTRLPPDVRQGWLADATLPRASDNPSLNLVRDQVLLALTDGLEELPAAEAALFLAAVEDLSFTVDSLARKAAVVHGSAIHPPLRSRAWDVVSSSLGTEDGPNIAAEWLLVEARAGRLTDGVARLRAAAASSRVDELPFLRGLARVVVSDARAQAAAVLRQLGEEPHLREGLSALLAVIEKERS